MTQMQQSCFKLRIKATLVKIDNLFIHKEGENYEIPSGVVADLYLIFVLSGKTWAIQAMTMWLRRLNGVIYYICTFGYSTILDLYISIDVLGMSEDT